MKKSIISISLTLALLGGCASSPSVSEADIFQQYPSIQEASTLLMSAKAAKTQADKAKYTFEEVLLAREKALDVNATAVAPEDFQEAEKEFAKAIALLEIGQDAKAKKG